MSEQGLYRIVRYQDGKPLKRRERVPAEASLDLYLCDTRIVTLQATPQEELELAIGFLLSEGLLEDHSEYVSGSVDADGGAVRVEARDRSRVLSRLLERGEVIRTSGCGRGTSFGGYGEIGVVMEGFSLAAASVTRLTGEMLTRALLHKEYGGVHCSALAGPDQILFVSEDIGRHNTIDKIIGKGVLSDVKLNGCLVLTTGRISSEMVAKCARLNVPMMASISCPTDMAVDLGQILGVTLIGYVRGKRITVYTHADRVVG